MKKLAWILLALALVGCGNKCGNEELRNFTKKVEATPFHEFGEPRKIGWSKVCIDGYEYIVWRGSYDSRAITQRFKNSNGGHLRAVECK